MSFIALGICIISAVGGQLFFAAAWAFITAGWFATAMWLWRKHVRDDDLASEQARQLSKGGKRA